jgi:hypothetical protein
MAGRLGRKPAGQLIPLGSRAQNPQYPVQDRTVVLAGAPTPVFPRFRLRE